MDDYQISFWEKRMGNDTGSNSDSAEAVRLQQSLGSTQGSSTQSQAEPGGMKTMHSCAFPQFVPPVSVDTVARGRGKRNPSIHTIPHRPIVFCKESHLGFSSLDNGNIPNFHFPLRVHDQSRERDQYDSTEQRKPNSPCLCNHRYNAFSGVTITDRVPVFMLIGLPTPELPLSL